jgi:hypothetical protein
MIRIGETGKKSVEVSLKIRKSGDRRERLANAAPPPFPLEAPQLGGPQPESEGQPWRGTESMAKTGGDGILGGFEAEFAREAGVGASDRLARLEQSAGGVEEYGSDQEKETVTSLHSFAGCGVGSSGEGSRRAHQKTSHSTPHAGT